jgi:hypothetical protein
MLQIIGSKGPWPYEGVVSAKPTKLIINLTSKEARELANNIAVASDEADDHGMFSLELVTTIMLQIKIKGCSDEKN